MQPVILFRRDSISIDEMAVCGEYNNTVSLRSLIDKDSLVVGRYSVLPFYRELEDDISVLGSRLINTYEQHSWIANHAYYTQLRAHMPRCWTESEFVRSDYPGPFVVKGTTNSRKHQWNSMMFAATRRQATEIASNLKDDSLIASQGIIYKEYVPLVTYEIGINGVPFTNEWRFFYLGTHRLGYGYYWSEADDPGRGSVGAEGLALADTVAAIAAKHVNFFVVDIAQKQDGSWTLIELNDGQMSGLSMIDAHALYSNLSNALSEQTHHEQSELRTASGRR